LGADTMWLRRVIVNIYEEWRMFTDGDVRTYPEGLCEIEMEYSDWVRRKVVFSRDAGYFSALGGSNGATPLRWRYLPLELSKSLIWPIT